MSKKIINNHMYNTETAKQLGYWSNGYNYYDLYFAEETLYQKDTGEYFLVGCGGAMSSYSVYRRRSEKMGNGSFRRRHLHYFVW